MGVFLPESSLPSFLLRFLNNGVCALLVWFSLTTGVGSMERLGVTEPSRPPIADLMSSSSGCLGNAHRERVLGLRMVICSTSVGSLQFSASSLTFINVRGSTMSGDAPFSNSTPAHISLPFFVAAKSGVIPSLFRLSKDTFKHDKPYLSVIMLQKLIKLRMRDGSLYMF